MSIFCDISGVVVDALSLVLPRTCIACGRTLLEAESCMCIACRYNMPTTNFAKQKSNPIKRLFENVMPIESAAALFWFVGGSEWQRIIHNFKYYNRWFFAQKMGEWLGEELRDSGNFEDIDLIIPIPLHFRKRLLRGYNQSEQLAIGVGRKMGVECNFRAIKRCRYNDSQTSKSNSERWENVDNIFEVRDSSKLRGRHILLVDDVLTTGATIGSCAHAIFDACGGDVRISVASLAVSRRIKDGW
ncbi:MAG: ComF family protein [Rikenellaceae bacterium]|nr:ComF family protein [Rikenellaceae bacterium]